jgi:hypothetical protein
MTQLGGSSVSPGGVQVASVILTAAELRTLSLNIGGHAYKAFIPGLPGKRVAIFHGSFESSGTIPFLVNGTISVTSQSDDIGGGTGNPFLGSGSGSILAPGDEVTDIPRFGPLVNDNTVSTIGEGAWVEVSGYTTALADLSVTITVLYQYF